MMTIFQWLQSEWGSNVERLAETRDEHDVYRIDCQDGQIVEVWGSPRLIAKYASRRVLL
jgi:hypothetical protein